jgi:hypothetical protein
MIAFPVLLVALFAAVIAGYFLPPVPGPWYPGAHFLLAQIVMLYGALALPFGFALALCFAAGFLWDALNAQMVDSSVEIALGWSIVVYGFLGTVMNGFRPLHLRGRWEVHCIGSALACSFIVLGEYLMITFRRGEFLFGAEIWLRIAGTGLAAALVAPVIYFALDGLMVLLRQKPSPAKARKEAW